MSTLKMIPHELPCYWYMFVVWLCNEHDIKVVQVLLCDMKSFPCNALLITMLSMESLMYDIMNCGLKSSDQVMSCVSVSFHRVLGVFILEKYSCVPRAKSYYPDNLSQAMIYRTKSVKWLRKPLKSHDLNKFLDSSTIASVNRSQLLSPCTTS